MKYLCQAEFDKWSGNTEDTKTFQFSAEGTY